MLDIEIKNNLDWIRLLFPVTTSKTELIRLVNNNINTSIDYQDDELISINFFTESYCYLIGYEVDKKRCNRINSVEVYDVNGLDTPIQTIELMED